MYFLISFCNHISDIFWSHIAIPNYTPSLHVCLVNTFAWARFISILIIFSLQDFFAIPSSHNIAN